MIDAVSPRYDHLVGMVDGTGVFEHARFGVARRRHGYTTDDAARALIVLSRAPATPEVDRAIAVLLSFALDAIDTGSGLSRNRLGFDRSWRDHPHSGDHHGRLAWALGELAAMARRPEWRAAALAGFGELALPEGPHLRPHAYAALGAVAVRRCEPGHATAAALLDRAIAGLAGPWAPWPESRLSYANGRLPQALIAIGRHLGDPTMVATGVDALTWLEAMETRDGRFSFTPAGGWAPGEPRPGFDQQPIEAAAMAGAAAAAWDATADPAWVRTVGRVASWLLGDNDIGVAIYDPDTGACCDGILAGEVNANRGAESTISGLEVLQVWDSLRTQVLVPAALDRDQEGDPAGTISRSRSPSSTAAKPTPQSENP